MESSCRKRLSDSPSASTAPTLYPSMHTILMEDAPCAPPARSGSQQLWLLPASVRTRSFPGLAFYFRLYFGCESGARDAVAADSANIAQRQGVFGSGCLHESHGTCVEGPVCWRVWLTAAALMRSSGSSDIPNNRSTTPIVTSKVSTTGMRTQKSS
ncbi:hypothetical protein VUR80DRAFT_5297 [Thermomyces stellatus]